MPLSFCIKSHSETQGLVCVGMSGGRSPRHAQKPFSREWRKTFSVSHHALSPPPSHHHLYIIHLINWLQRFYRITMSLKRAFVPKSDDFLLLLLRVAGFHQLMSFMGARCNYWWKIQVLTDCGLLSMTRTPCQRWWKAQLIQKLLMACLLTDAALLQASNMLGKLVT